MIIVNERTNDIRNAINYFETVKSDKSIHFTTALDQYEKEDETLTGFISDRFAIKTVTILSKVNLRFLLIFWDSSTMHSTDLNADSYVGSVDLDLENEGIKFYISPGTFSHYYLSVEDVNILYYNKDGIDPATNTYPLYCSLVNMSASSKPSIPDGEVVIKITYSNIS